MREGRYFLASWAAIIALWIINIRAPFAYGEAASLASSQILRVPCALLAAFDQIEFLGDLVRSWTTPTHVTTVRHTFQADGFPAPCALAH